MKLYNIVKVYTSTTGTGTVTLGSAVPSFLTFSGAGVTNGSTVSYAIEDGSQREVGTGVYNSGTQTLTRSVITSTNSNNAIPLSGAGVVFITGIASDLVTGAADLSTVGAIPYVSASGGILNQDATALFWDAANDRLGIGTNAPSVALHVKGSLPTLLIENTAVNNTTLQLKTSGGLNHYIYSDAVRGNALNIATGSGTALIFSPFATESARFAATTGNLLIGTTTDSNFKLDVAASGSAGTMRVYDQTATTGTTRLDIRAGAGQSGATLRVQDSAGTAGFSVGADTVTVSGVHGVLSGQSQFGLTGAGYGFSGLQLYNSGQLGWSSTSDYSATKDLGLARNAAGVLEINNGTTGTYRDLILRRSRHNGVTVADLPTAAAGNAGSIQYVTDANATTIGSTVAGGGANKVMVWSDGAAWKIFAS